MRLRTLLIWLTVFSVQELSMENDCMLWEIIGNDLTFSCKTSNFVTPVTLVNNRGKEIAKCNFQQFNNESIRCSQRENSHTVSVEVQKKEVRFTIHEFSSKNVDGTWSCVQGNTKSQSHVSKSKEIFYDTNVFMKGEIYTINHTKMVSLQCSTCRESRGKNAEFLINKRSYVSIAFDPDKGKCTYKDKECHQDICSCSSAGNVFNATFSFDPANTTTYSCDIQFEDKATSMIFSITANLLFNGKDFQVMRQDRHINKPGNKVFDRDVILTTKRNLKTDPESVNATVTPTKVDENIPYVSKGNEIIWICVAIFVTIIISISVALGYCRHQKKKEKDQRNEQQEENNDSVVDLELGNQQPEEERHLLEDSVPVCVIATYTSMTNEDRLYLGCQTQGTMTKESYLHNLAAGCQNQGTMTKESYLQYLEAENNAKKIEAKIEAKIISGESTRCYPCSVLNKLIEGLYWCLDCGNSLCFLCNTIHQVMSSHSIVDIQKLPKNYAVSFFCTQHTQRRLDYFCINHDKLCCLECRDAHQPKCTKTEHIDVVSKSYGQSQVYRDYEDQLDFGIGVVTTINVRLSRNIKSIENECHQIEEIIARNESVEKEGLSKLNTELTEKKAKCLSTLQNYISEAKTLEASTEEQKRMFEFFKQNGSDKLLFVLINYSKQTLVTRNTKIQHLLEDINRLSILYMECDEENPDAERMKIVKRKHNTLPDKNQIETNMQIRIGPAVISFVGDSEIKGAKTPGSMVVSKDGLLLVCDAIHSAILVVAENRQTEVSIILRYPPRDISLIPDMDTAVLTCQSDHIIQFVDIREQKCLSEKDVEGSADCSLVCTEEYILIGGKMKIIVLDHEGKYITNIETDSVLRNLSYFNKRIYFTEYGSNNVRCIEMNGYKVVNVFCHQSKDVAAPICVAPNKEGHVYILDRGPIKIHKLSAYGRKIPLEIKGNSDLLNPRAMCLSKDYSRLYILNKGGSRISAFEV